MFFLLYFLMVLFPIFLVFPIFSTGITLGVMLKYKQYSRFLLFFLMIAISLPILRYRPYLDDDSSFHYFAAFAFSEYSGFLDLLEAFQEGVNFGRYAYQDYPIYGFFLYIFSGTYTYSLISFSACFIAYYCYTYVVVDIFRRENMSKLSFLLAFLGVLFANNYRYTTSGMRYCMAMAILMLLLYIDFRIERKNKLFYLLYFIPQLIHASSLFFIAIRFAFFYLNKVTLSKSILVFLIFPFLLYIFPLLSTFIDIPYIDMFANKIEAYSNNDSFEEILESATLQLRMLIGVGVIIVYLLLFCYVYKRIYFESIKYKKFIILTYYYGIISLGTTPFLNIYDRNLFILYPMIIISISILLLNLRNIAQSNDYNVIKFICYGVYCVCFSVGIVYNFNFPFHLLDYSLIELLTTNIFSFFSDLPIYYQ